MRFERKLILPEDPPENEQGELELPDDLAMLAAQLEDDARSLSGLFPAKQLGDLAVPKKPAAIASKPSTNWLRVATLITAASLLIVPGMWWRSGTNAIQVVLPPQVLTNVTGDLPDEPVQPSSNAIENMAPMPAMFLKDFSGPELEGLYDLINESGDEDKLSI